MFPRQQLRLSLCVSACWLVALVSSWFTWVWLGRVVLILTTIPLCLSWYTLGRSDEMEKWFDRIRRERESSQAPYR